MVWMISMSVIIVVIIESNMVWMISMSVIIVVVVFFFLSFLPNPSNVTDSYSLDRHLYGSLSKTQLHIHVPHWDSHRNLYISQLQYAPPLYNSCSICPKLPIKCDKASVRHCWQVSGWFYGFVTIKLHYRVIDDPSAAYDLCLIV